MSFGASKSLSRPMKKSIIYVDSYEDKLIKGRFSHHEGVEQRFDNLIQLLIKIKNTFDSDEDREDSTTIKKFSSDNEKKIISLETLVIPESLNKFGKLATFYINVIFKQNASLQGVITWVERQKEESFRSVYELICLMDSALEAAK